MNSIKLLSFLLILTMTLTSCGQKESGGDANPMSSSIIVGGLDWQEVTILADSSFERQNSFAVAHLDLPAMGSRCTGFLISENVLMTNQHCIPSASYARGVVANFQYEDAIPKSQQETFDCSEFLGNNRELDFALLKCQGSPGLKYGYLELSDESVSQGSSMYVLQQNCDYYSERNCDPTKKISKGKITEAGSSYTHNADTLGGSSGSPVFSQSNHQVVAIHHAGLGNDGRGRGVENYSVPMARIVPFILARFPDVLASSDDPDTPEPPAPVPSGNDSFDRASSLKEGVTLNGSISSSNDLDYFKVSVDKRKYVSFKLRMLAATGDLDLYVYSSSKQLLAKSEGTSKMEEIKGTASSGSYYILVKGYKGAQGKYKLEFN